MLRDVLGEVVMDPALLSVDAKAIPKAPGMKYTHYSPNADVVIYKGDTQKVVDAINKRLLEDAQNGIRSSVLCDDETKTLFKTTHTISLGSRNHPNDLAAHLFESLRCFDDLGMQKVYALAFSEDGIGSAIMNRLEKSAGHHIIEI